MPFIKSNWICEPGLPDGGYFDFGRGCKISNIALRRGEQTRPCFVHELDNFDYRHITKIQGLPANPENSAFIFDIDPSFLPTEKVWQLQLKLSSTRQNLTTVQLMEATVQVDRAHGLGEADSTPRSLPSQRSFQDTTQNGILFSSARSDLTTSLAGSRGESNRPHTTRLGFSLPRSAHEDMATSASSHHPFGGNSSLSLSTSNRPAGALTDYSASTTTLGMTDSTLDHSRQPHISSTTSANRPIKQQGSATIRSTTSSHAAASDASVGASSIARQAAWTGELALRSRGLATGTAAASTGGELSTSHRSGSQVAELREETAAVASVLNAVCEKMVGVVSEKTKAYLAKAGKRTQRRVLDKMAKLEARIERFDQVLEHTNTSSKEIEEAILALDKDLLLSTRTSRAGPAPPAADAALSPRPVSAS